MKFAKLYKGPSALGYDVGTKGWWDCAVRLNYRSAREALARARYWLVRLTEHLDLPASRRSSWRALFLLECFWEAMTSADFWREQGRNTRVSRATRVATLGPLPEDAPKGKGDPRRYGLE